MKSDLRNPEKNAFTSLHCLFQFKRMLFELRRVPITFQRAMDVIAKSVK